MAYTNYDDSVPNFYPMDGTEFCDAVRNNQKAVWDIMAGGMVPIDWNLRLNISGASEEFPGIIVYDHVNGLERVAIDIVWGTTGAEKYNPTSIEYLYTANNGTSWDTIGTLTLNWSAASNNCTSMTWA